MSAREFWEDDPDLLWAYRISYMDKMKVEAETINYNAWLSGLYVFDAISKSLYNSFGRKSNSQPAQPYIPSPYDFSKTKEEIERERVLEVEAKIKERNREIKEILRRKKQVKQ